jgi:hypothetical protein
MPWPCLRISSLHTVTCPFLKAIDLASAIIVARAGPVQFPDLTVPSSAAADLASVTEIFKKSYDALQVHTRESLGVVLGLRSWMAVIENLLLVMTRWHQYNIKAWTLG